MEIIRGESIIILSIIVKRLQVININLLLKHIPNIFVSEKKKIIN